jgi:hypothetical protein
MEPLARRRLLSDRVWWRHARTEGSARCRTWPRSAMRRRFSERCACKSQTLSLSISLSLAPSASRSMRMRTRTCRPERNANARDGAKAMLPVERQNVRQAWRARRTGTHAYRKERGELMQIQNLAPSSASVHTCLHSRSRTRRHTEHMRRSKSALGRMCMAGSGPHAHLRAGDAASAEARHPESTVATTARRGIQGWQGAALFSSAPRCDGGHFLSSRKGRRTASSPRVIQSHSDNAGIRQTGAKSRGF